MLIVAGYVTNVTETFRACNEKHIWKKRKKNINGTVNTTNYWNRHKLDTTASTLVYWRRYYCYMFRPFFRISSSSLNDTQQDAYYKSEKDICIIMRHTENAIHLAASRQRVTSLEPKSMQLSLSDIASLDSFFSIQWHRQDFTLATNRYNNRNNHLEVNLLSRVWVTIDGIWIGNWIYWTLTERNCK
jgi:hypothetical protein